ncbi:MAG: hypothetical protein ACFFBM_14290, partial [Promethearchaeota archaeon]
PFPGEEELRAKTTRRVHIGFLLLATPIFLLLSLFILPSFIREWAALPILGLIFLGAISGAALVSYYGESSRLFYHSLDLIRKLTPDEVILKGRYAVAKIGRVFLVAYWGSNALLFVVFLHSMPAERQKLDVPSAIWRWEYKIDIEGFKIARRQEHFTIPISQEDFIAGEGILYSLLIESMPPIRVLQHPSEQQIRQIASQLDAEATALGSGTIM